MRLNVNDLILMKKNEANLLNFLTFLEGMNYQSFQIFF